MSDKTVWLIRKPIRFGRRINCDRCQKKEAVYNAKTQIGWWAYLCEECCEEIQEKGRYL